MPSPQLEPTQTMSAVAPPREEVRPLAPWWRDAQIFLQQTFTLLRKDLTIELRTKDLLSSMLVFALLVLVIFNFAFDLRGETLLLVAPGILWVALFFAGVLGLGRTFAQERERDTLEGILLCPMDRGALYLAKMLGSLLFTGFLAVAILPLLALFFNLPVLRAELLLILFLGTWGFTAVGTLFAAIAVNTRAREVMLPVLLFPILVPVIIASVKATALVLDGKSWASSAPWLNLLLVFDVLFFVLSFLIFDYVVED